MNLLDQVRRDISKIEGRGLGSIEDLDLLTNLLLCEWRLTEKHIHIDGHSGSSASTSNHIVDRDVNKLFHEYQTARERYKSDRSEENETAMLESLEALTDELYDMVYVINCSAVIEKERDIVGKFSEKISCI